MLTSGSKNSPGLAKAFELDIKHYTISEHQIIRCVLAK